MTMRLGRKNGVRRLTCIKPGKDIAKDNERCKWGSIKNNLRK